MLARCNTYRVGFAGLAIGGAAIIASVAAFFRLLANPPYLIALYWALEHVRAHDAATLPADLATLAQLAGALVAIGGAVVLALLMSYFGMPSSVGHAASPAAAPSEDPTGTTP